MVSDKEVSGDEAFEGQSTFVGARQIGVSRPIETLNLLDWIKEKILDYF